MHGRTAVVTGAAAGVGRGIALALGDAGAQVVVTARRIEAAQEVADEVTARGGKAWATVCDVVAPGDIERVLADTAAQFGSVYAVVHNATSRRSSEPVDLEHADAQLWDEHSSVSLRGAFTIARAAYGYLKDSQGAFLLLTSPAGMHGSANLSFYAAVKGGQRGFVKALAREWGPDGVRVNGLAPLAVTPALDQAFRLDPAMVPRITNQIPMRRVGDPVDDIGPVAAFLCSPGAQYVTGQTLVVSGGRLTSL